MEFENPLIYTTFENQYRNYYDDIPYSSIGPSKYERFIDSLDLAIKWKRVPANNIDVYEIIDEKKWFLAKIKYGI